MSEENIKENYEVSPEVMEAIRLAISGDVQGAAEALKSLLNMKKESFLLSAKEFMTKSLLECSCEDSMKAPSDLEATGEPNKEDKDFKSDE